MTKNKDKKGKESTIGKIIYGFLLFMPLIAIASTILYTSFNKNAYLDRNVKNVEIKNETLTLITNQKYVLYFTNDQTGQTNNTSPLIKVNSLSITIPENTYAIRFTNTNRINFYNSNNTLITQSEELENVTYSVSENNNLISQPWFKNYVGIFVKNSLEDAFYNSIDKVENSNLFNWAKNSIVYTTLVTTCNALSITNTFIPMLLAYWLIISVIYILYDIALMMILIFHHKVHCLQDSI